MASGKRSRTKVLTHIKDARGLKVTQLDPVELRLLEITLAVVHYTLLE